MQPTLPGIGPDDVVDVDMGKTDAVPTMFDAPLSQPMSTMRDPNVAPATVREPSPMTVRDPEPTVLEELDASAIIEELRPSSPTPPIPLLRVVPPAPPSSPPSSIPVSVPISAPVAAAPALGPVAPRQVVTPAPMPVAQPVASVPPPAASTFPPAPMMAPTAFVPQFVPQPSPVIAQAPVAQAPVVGRPSLSDPMDLLFDAAYDLCFLQSAVEGATHAIVSGMNALGARAGLVHLIDGNTGEFVTVAGQGMGSDRQLLSRHEDDDWLISAALFKGKPLTMEYGGEVSGRPLSRHAALGVQRNVIVVPILAWGRALGVLEIVDASETALAGGRGENALAYLAQRLAEFLGEHEIVLGVA